MKLKDFSGNARERRWHTWLSGLIALEQWFEISNVDVASNAHNFQLKSEIVKVARWSSLWCGLSRPPRERFYTLIVLCVSLSTQSAVISTQRSTRVWNFRRCFSIFFSLSMHKILITFYESLWTSRRPCCAYAIGKVRTCAGQPNVRM